MGSLDCDLLVIGGGIVGLSVAREWKARQPDQKVVLLEKEPSCGLHASGRNSGVIHAGFYYSADSLKARLTRQGNELLTAYCESRGLPLNRCGKLVLAKGPEELPALEELLRRGKANGVDLREVSAAEARCLEPRAKTYQKALFSPSTSSVDPGLVVATMKADALKEGIVIREGVSYTGRTDRGVTTSAGPLRASFVVNAAGLYADRIARDFGFSKRYRILPFKGLYLYSDEPKGALKVNLYPVPDLRNPFLGVHFTVTAHGDVKIGPTAIPALWREQYEGFENFSATELLEIAWRDLGLLFSSDFDFKRLAIEELRKRSAARMAELASGLAEGVRPEHYRRWGKPGIRAQLLDIETRRLEMDFVIEGDSRSLHILNAVSPGFTCALSFSRHICDRAASLR